MRTLRAGFHTIFWIANCPRYSEAITPPNMFRSRFPRIGLSVQRSFIRSFSNHKMPGLRHDFTYGIDKFMGPGAFEISWTNYQKLMVEKLNQAIAGGFFSYFLSNILQYFIQSARKKLPLAVQALSTLDIVPKLTLSQEILTLRTDKLKRSLSCARGIQIKRQLSTMHQCHSTMPFSSRAFNPNLSPSPKYQPSSKPKSKALLDPSRLSGGILFSQQAQCLGPDLCG